MSPRSRGAKRVVDIFASSSSAHHVCSSCLQTLSRRGYASAGIAKSTVDSQSLPSPPPGPEASPAPQPNFAIKAGIVLSRPPLITPDPHPFETAYYLYQRRLNERLVLPFSQYFYYRRNTPAFEHWRKFRRARAGTAARDVGAYSAYTEESWNDEVLVGDETGRPEKIVEALITEEGRQGEFTGKGDPRFAGLRRTTEADASNDQRSLERRLQRTLYLLVKTKQAKGQQVDEDSEKWAWKFPSGSIVGFEGLKDAAQRILLASLGPNMNTFFVGNHPVGHYVARFSSPRPGTPPQFYVPGHRSEKPPTSAPAAAEQPTVLMNGEKTFFMKARIMAGQADLSAASANATATEKNADKKEKNNAPKGAAEQEEIEDFRWLSKDEVEVLVHPDYWKGVKNMLVAQ